MSIRDRFDRVPSLLAICLCIAFLAAFSVSYVALLAGGQAGPKQTDFVPYYTAGKLVLDGSGTALYDQNVVGRSERHLVRPLHVKDGVMPFLYPPFFAVLMAPLAALPYTAAYIFWLLTNCCLLAGSLLMLQRYTGASGRGALLLWLGGVSFLPILLTLAQGQASLLILALLVAVFISLRSGRDWVGGALLAPVLIKPPYVVPILLVLLLQWRWRSVLAFAGSAAALFAMPSLLLGSGVVSGFFRTMIDAASWKTQIGGFEPKFNQSFAGVAQLAFPTHLATIATVGLDALAIAVLCWAAWSRRFEHAYAIAILVGLLIGPHVLLHDLALLAIPAVIAIHDGVSDVRLGPLLAGCYVTVVAGLALVAPLHTQLSVAAMVAMLAWLITSLKKTTILSELPRAITSILPTPNYQHVARITRAHR